MLDSTLPKVILITGVSEEIQVYLLYHRRWPVTEKEEYPIVYALQKLHYFLGGPKFGIKTGHQHLKDFFAVDWINKKIQMWTLTLSMVEYL